jgi:hypothetical protein
MSTVESALAVAQKEVCFWQELADHLRLPKPGILKALEHARGRYEKAAQLLQKSNTL